MYVTFRLDDEVFALGVSQVQEVLDMSPITKVPRAPDFMRGVTNVRGSVIPVVDLRLKLGFCAAEATVNTRIIIIKTAIGGRMTLLGAIADSVNDVVQLAPGQIEAPPSLGSRWKSEFITGIGKKDGQFIILLDIIRVFSSDDLLVVKGAGRNSDISETNGDDDFQQTQATLKPTAGIEIDTEVPTSV